MAIRSNGELRRYHQRKGKRGLHHLSAVTAAALKLTRIAWRIVQPGLVNASRRIGDILPVARGGNAHEMRRQEELCHA